MGKQAITWFYSSTKERAVCRTAEELDTSYCLKNNYPTPSAAEKNMDNWITRCGWKQVTVAEFKQYITDAKRQVELYTPLVKKVEPVVYKDLGDGTHSIICTSEALVVLSAAVNLQECHMNDDDKDEVWAKSVAKSAGITPNRVWELSEELIVNIPSDFGGEDGE